MPTNIRGTRKRLTTWRAIDLNLSEYEEGESCELCSFLKNKVSDPRLNKSYNTKANLGNRLSPIGFVIEGFRQN